VVVWSLGYDVPSTLQPGLGVSDGVGFGYSIMCQAAELQISP